MRNMASWEKKLEALVGLKTVLCDTVTNLRLVRKPQVIVRKHLWTKRHRNLGNGMCLPSVDRGQKIMGDTTKDLMTGL